MTTNNFSYEGDATSGDRKAQAAQHAGEVRDHARDEAGQVKDHAVTATRDVAQTAGAEAKSVARDARTELRGLMDSGLSELNTQAGTGQQRLAASLREIVDEIGEMAGGSQRHGVATQFARELSDRGNGLVGWLEGHEPREALDQVRRYASRNPWTFLAIAAGAGLLVGRFARGLRDDGADSPEAVGYAQPPQPMAYADPRYQPGYTGEPRYQPEYPAESAYPGVPVAGQRSEVQGYDAAPVNEGYPTGIDQDFGQERPADWPGERR